MIQPTEKQIAHAKFWKKFLRLTRGRVPVMRALHVMWEEETEPGLKKAAKTLREKIDNGSTMSDAMKEQDNIFSPSILELIRTAEKTGAWDEILEEISSGLREGIFD